MRKPLLWISAGALLLTSTALTAQYQVRSLDPRLVAAAQREHAEIVQEHGGAEAGQRGAYVNSVGHRVAAQSGVANPGSAYRFTLLNSAVENAFAQPGGYIYVTRQLMGLLDNESELAFALAHEVGHVAAGHAQARQQATRRYAKRQMTWFRREPDVRWLKGFGDDAEIQKAAGDLVMKESGVGSQESAGY